MQRILSRSLALAVFFGPMLFSAVASAQIVDEPLPSDTVLGDVSSRGTGLTGGPAGNASCFDYYNFGSAVTNIASIVDDAVPGTVMTFSGSIANENPYPLVNLDLYVKLFRKQADDPDTHLNGHHLVAQFVAAKGLNIDAQGERQFSFQWPVPAGTIPGDYYLATYAMTNEAYNLSGLSFTNDVTGSTAPFVVSGQSAGILAWDKNQVMMNGNPFHFAAFIPQFPKDEPVTVKAPFVNTTQEDKTITLTWKQYSWDGLRESALVDTRVEQVTIPAGQTKELAFVATKYTGAVTYLVADAEYLGTHSILDMRFARRGVEQARINFPSLTSFPLAQDQPTAMFSCLHTVGPDTLSGGKLDLVLTDGDGAVITQNTYEGPITGAMMGVKYDFTPEKDYDRVTLTTTLSRNGVIEDSGTVTYDCREIDPSKCLSKAVPSSTTRATFLKALGWMVLFVGIALAGALYFKRRKKTLPPAAVFIFALLSAWGWASYPLIVQADTTSWTSGVYRGDEMMGYPKCVGLPAFCLEEYDYGPTTPDEVPYLGVNFAYARHSVTKLSNIQATVNYSVDAKGGAVTLTNGSSTLTVGDVITFVPTFDDTQISWFETGNFNDSPYGQWGVDGQHGCRGADVVFTDSEILHGDVRLYASLQIPTPTVSLRGLSNLSCTGLTCTVTGPGVVTATVVYAPTLGVIYGASSKTKTAPGPNTFYAAGCLSSPYPLMDVAKLNAFSACSLGTEAGDIACYNNASNMKLTIDVPEKTIPFSFTAANPTPTLTMTGAKHVALGHSLWDRVLALIRPYLSSPVRASGAKVTIESGESVDLTWTSTNVDQCTLTIPGQADRIIPLSQIASGSAVVSGLSVGNGQVLTMTCSNPITRASVANDDISDSVTVDVARNALQICPPAYTMKIGDVYGMRAYYLIGGVDCANPGTAVEVTNTVTWTSSASSIATVQNSPNWGRLNALAVGTTNITISPYAGKTAAPAVVTVTASSTVNGVCGTTADTCSAGTYSSDPADSSTDYLWTCLGTGSPAGTNAPCSAPMPVYPASLHICPATPTVAVGGTLQLIAWYIPEGTGSEWFNSCSDMNGAINATTDSNWYSFSEGYATVTLNGGLLTGVSEALGVPIQAMYHGLSPNETIYANVSCRPYITCSTSPHDARAANMCPDKNFTIDDGCGGIVTCTGTRTCDFNWKEVGQ